MDQLSTKLFEFVTTLLTDELIRQGHKLTGALIESFEKQVREEGDKLSIDFLMLIYGRALNDGIKPSKIPYDPDTPARGKISKYIQGLIDFALKKFTLDKKVATGIAFAIAKKQKEKGYPLTGKIHFIDNVMDVNSDEIADLISLYYETVLEEIIKEHLNFEQ